MPPPSAKAIRLLSGDHASAPVERVPPPPAHLRRKTVPSGFMVKWLRLAMAMRVPSGDQDTRSMSMSANGKPDGVISVRPVPSSLTV
jgi:hypothetical protein